MLRPDIVFSTSAEGKWKGRADERSNVPRFASSRVPIFREPIRSPSRSGCTRPEPKKMLGRVNGIPQHRRITFLVESGSGTSSA